MILGCLVAAVAFAAVAYADDIKNDLPGTVKVMALNENGTSGSTDLTVTPQNGDGKNGCNLTGASSLVVSVSSDNTSVATVSPTSLTFTSCGDVKTLTVTPHDDGSANITLSQTSNTTGGSFNLAPAAFRVNVAPPANTAPNVSVTGVAHGASYAKGSVPAAGCSVQDAEDGNSGFAASLGAITGTYASDGLGNQTATCSYTDGGGLTETVTATYSIYDPSAPSIGSTLNPAAPDGNDGWYKSNVSLTWNVSEPESPNSLSKEGCVNQSITADQVATSYLCSASSAGGSSGPVSVVIKRDATPPSVSGSPTTSPNGAGWYKNDVVIGWTCGDDTSGLAAACPADSTISSEGLALTASSGDVFDNAGNSASAVSSPAVKIDKTAPSVSLVGGPANGASYYFGFVPAAPTCSALDALSGLAGSCSVSGYSSAVGSHTVKASATDIAGNSAEASNSYSVLAWSLSGFFQPVDMGGVFNTVKSGSTVPLKFRVSAGSTELTDVAAVKTVSYVKILCSGGVIEDAVEEVAPAGSTLLRYDSTGGQFIYNLKTSGKAGDCYRATMTTQDGSTLVANFKLK